MKIDSNGFIVTLTAEDAQAIIFEFDQMIRDLDKCAKEKFGPNSSVNLTNVSNLLFLIDKLMDGKNIIG